MTGLRVPLTPLFIVPILIAGAVLPSPRAVPAFPHDKHSRVFPVCDGCHAGILTGDKAALFPEPADCYRCHDGTRRKRVEWEPRARRVSNLAFSHTMHRERMATSGDSATCQTCHASEGAPRRMNVGGPQPAACVGCHAHRNALHLSATAACNKCHIPLTRATDLPVERVAKFPRPPWHDAAGFAVRHGRDSVATTESCAVCHARETCERCHVNADRVERIVALGRDARVAALERGKTASYPAPESHQNDAWQLEHGRPASAPSASCANCHTQAGCTGCHATGDARAVILALPTGKAGAAAGVSLTSMARTPHAADIALPHGTAASAGKLDCTKCHTQQTCAACHAGSDSREFHAADFVERHAVEVFAGRGECQSCHNTERFCRACHTRTGVASQSRMNAAFHTGQPMWVLSHGQAARTGMESCASCHRQNDCMRCHSAAGGWRVNPHGPGFAAARLASRNSATCSLCHLGTPGAVKSP